MPTFSIRTALLCSSAERGNKGLIRIEGNVWATERVSGMLGRFDSKTPTYTRIAPPQGKSSERSLSSMAVDSQDHVWFTDNGPNGLPIEYSPKDRKFAVYPNPVPPNLGPAVVQCRFLDGNIWGTGLQESSATQFGGLHIPTPG